MSPASLTVLGWASTACLALGGIPQAYKTWKDGHSDGLSTGMLALWLSGELFLLAYVICTKDWPVAVNAGFNVLIAAYISWYKIYPTASPKSPV